jgi:GTP pyrophosphokinase
MKGITSSLYSVLSKENIKADISGRPKHIYSIYKKMHRKGVPFEMVFDVRGVRIIVPNIPTCYSTLGVIHTHWRPIPDEFDDYIAAPKDNFYQSLHTAVVFDDGRTLEIQIRTPEMDQGAEYGIASHWRYKEGVDRDEDYERRILWLRSLMEWRQDVIDAGEFVDGLKSDVFEDRVYLFTPRGDIIDLPAGSTPIDFAYHVHTDVGHRCRGAKVNGKLVSLDYQLNTGEKIEILTAKRGGPSLDWLNPNLGLVKTQRARSKIRRWFKVQAREKNISQGKVLLDKELRRLGLTKQNFDKLAKEFDFRTVEDLY